MNPTDDETWRARVHLAAANRLAVYDDLEEGIDNHFTMRVPGQEDRYLVLPFGLHWSEARASDLIVFNEAGEVLEGSGSLELSALSIHAPLHRITGANVILHTHQTWALALNMLEDNRLLPGSQTAAFLTRNIAYDDGYTGLAASLSEGRAPRVGAGRQADHVHEEPRRAGGGRHRRAGVPAPVQAGARLPRAGPGDVHRPAARACWTRRW